MEEKKYLKWYNKVGYGSGDIAGNVVFAFLSSFIMIYLTNTVGLNAGVIGSLIAASKVLDGISDVVFGSMIDRTHTKMGKARPWMLGAYFGCAITLIAAFSVPTTMGKTSQYVWFFITYLLLNAGFYTANNIAYSTLTALITKNVKERVQMGSIRFMFAFGTSFIIQTITVGLVQKLGGGAEGWRTIAIIYAIIGLISNTLTVFSVKELPEEELRNGEEKVEEKYSLIESIKMLVHNKYYIVILVVDILRQTYSAIINCGIYYMTYVLGKYDLVSWIYRRDVEDIYWKLKKFDWRKYHTKILQYMQGEREFYVNVAAYEGQNSILDYITSYAIICMEMQVKEEMGMNILPEDVELSIYMWNLASTRLTFTWLKEKDERKPEEITDLICNCVPEPIKIYYQ